MTVRTVIALIKRHENVKVIVNSRVKISEDYKRTVHDLEDILINDEDNIEIIMDSKVIEIPANEVIVSTGITSTIFYERLRVILFNY